MTNTYIIALGSNRRHHRFGLPRSVITHVFTALGHLGDIIGHSSVLDSDPVGPSTRRYANAAILMQTALPPKTLLAELKRVERTFGLRRGQRWGARVLDLDIILWSGGTYFSKDLIIPHIMMHDRPFVLRPAAQIAPDWRDPLTGRTLRQLNGRLTRSKSLPKRSPSRHFP